MLGCQNRKSSVVNLAVAFLFGLISHQVADISWHSMEGLQDGFISALSVLAFHDDWGAAHSYADVADDMIGHSAELKANPCHFRLEKVRIVDTSDNFR